MSFLERRTIVLLGIAAVLLGLNLLPGRGGSRAPELPSLAAIDASDVTRLSITRGVGDPVIIERSDAGGWDVVQPTQAHADEALVEGVLRLFREPVQMRVLIDLDPENYKDYGLDPANRILVELSAGGDLPAVSFELGYDAPGGSSFVRVLDDPAVYRARVGMRHRYDRSPGDWRDHMVTQEEPGGFLELRVQRPGDGLHFRRELTGELDPGGNQVTGPWRVAGDPVHEVDDQTVEALVRSLLRLRASEILSPSFEGGFDPPAATAVLTGADGREVELLFGSRTVEGAAFVRRRGSDNVYRVSSSVLDRLRKPLAWFRSLQVTSLDADSLAAIRLDDGTIPVRAEPDAKGIWHIVDPPNVDIDPRAIAFTVNTLASLRAHGIADRPPSEAGLLPPSMRFELLPRQGPKVEIAVGDRFEDERGRAAAYVSRDGGERVWVLPWATIARLRRGLGRSDAAPAGGR